MLINPMPVLLFSLAIATAQSEEPAGIRDNDMAGLGQIFIYKTGTEGSLSLGALECDSLVNIVKASQLLRSRFTYGYSSSCGFHDGLDRAIVIDQYPSNLFERGYVKLRFTGKGQKNYERWVMAGAFLTAADRASWSCFETTGQIEKCNFEFSNWLSPNDARIARQRHPNPMLEY